jgi:hypothetical protein
LLTPKHLERLKSDAPRAFIRDLAGCLTGGPIWSLRSSCSLIVERRAKIAQFEKDVGD